MRRKMRWPQLTKLDELARQIAPHMVARMHADAPLSAFAEQELRQMMTQTYDRVFPELDARQHIPIKPGLAAGAMALGFDRWDMRGRARFMGANARDVPRVDVGKERETHPVRAIVLGYGITIQEQMASAFSGIPLDQRKSDGVRRGMAETEHEVLLIGSAEENLPGFIGRCPMVPRALLPTGSWTPATSPDNIIKDLNFMVDAIFVATNRAFRPSVILLPLDKFRLIQTMPRSSTSDKTVLMWFLENNPYVREILPLYELGTANPSGGASALAYQKDPLVLEGIVPMPFRFLDPQVQGFETVVPAMQTIGGTFWYQPLGGCFFDNV